MADYTIYRGFLYFDTSNIPVEAVITSAVLSFKIHPEAANEGNGKIVIQNGQPNYPHIPLVVGDYNYANYSNNGGQSVAIDSLSDSEYNNITLNSNGRAWINKGGITKFCLRNSRDIDNVTIAENNRVAIHGHEKGEGYRPKLEITYEY